MSAFVWNKRSITIPMARQITGVAEGKISNLLAADPSLRQDFPRFVRENIKIEAEGETKAEALRRKAIYEADRAKIALKIDTYKLKEIEKATFSRDYVIARVADISKRFSDLLFSLPARVTSAIMGAESEAAGRQILDSELRKITMEVEKWKI